LLCFVRRDKKVVVNAVRFRATSAALAKAPFSDFHAVVLNLNEEWWRCQTVYISGHFQLAPDACRGRRWWL
jgi:hypothetical protein